MKRKHKAKQARVAAKNLSATSTSIVSYHSPASSRDSQTSEEDESLEIVQQHYSPLTEFSLAPNLEDNATAFFITNYVIKCDGPVRGHLDYISAICDPNEDGNLNPLIAAMKAVGIAGVAHTAKAPSLLKNARYLYMKAIQGTNAALKSPTLVKKDSTLTAIMILSIYETVTGCTQDSIRDWADHVKGAAALLKLRGREQLKTPRGRRMFLQIVSSLMVRRRIYYYNVLIVTIAVPLSCRLSTYGNPNPFTYLFQFPVIKANASTRLPVSSVMHLFQALY